MDALMATTCFALLQTARTLPSTSLERLCEIEEHIIDSELVGT